VQISHSRTSYPRRHASGREPHDGLPEIIAPPSGRHHVVIMQAPQHDCQRILPAGAVPI
jgi:hypothetical protein